VSATLRQRGWLEDAWDAVKGLSESEQDLRAELRKREKLALQSISGGSLSRVGANGRFSEFAEPGSRTVTSVDIQSDYRILVDLYDRVYRRLENVEEDDDEPTELEVYTEMMASLGGSGETCDEVTSDWSMARC
jgi:hypothetical protein